MKESLDAIFKPRSIAVIGASPRAGTIGHQILHNIIEYGFNGMVFPVNPKYRFIKSIKCHPSLSAIPDPVDMAIIAVKKDHVRAVAEECGEKGVKGLVIISAGFREVGGEGIAREEELVELQEKYGYRIVGPNCMGVINAASDVRLNGTFAVTGPQSGSLAFMSQSGALGVSILQSATKLNVGLSHFASVGNKVDVSGNDLIEYWADESDVSIIALYIESFGNPRRFTQLAKRITRKKPIILVKSGRTAAGARAASSHTGRLAGLEIAVDALLHQCGVIRVGTIEEMMDLALAFNTARGSIPAGDSIAIVSNAGGPAIMATDSLVSRGLTLATLGDPTRRKLASFLPEDSSVLNPVDMIAGAGPNEYERAVDVVLADDAVDAMITIFVPPIMIEPREVVEAIARGSARHSKPVFAVLMAEEEHYEALPKAVEGAPPLFRYPESAVRVIAAMSRYRSWCEKPPGAMTIFDTSSESIESIIIHKQRSGGGYLPPNEVNSVLEAYGFPVCKAELVPLDGDVTAAGTRVGYPLVLKTYGEHIIHKSDFGGVRTNIDTPEELEAARSDMLGKLKTAGVVKNAEGFLVQEMAKGGKEVILGMTTDEQFGPILMFGMGGKYVEIIKDITFRLMPLTDVDAQEMVREIKSYPLLEGVRGEEPVDIGFIVESLQRLAQIVNDLPAIVELDMNPVIVTAEATDSRVVDARIRVAGR
jgi:acetyltransferase